MATPQVGGSVALPRTFVGFSSSDIASYRLMTAWKAHEKIDTDAPELESGGDCLRTPKQDGDLLRKFDTEGRREGRS